MTSSSRKPAALLRDHGFDQLARHLPQQPGVRVELRGEVRSSPIIAVWSVTMKFSGEYRSTNPAEGLASFDRGPLAEEPLHAVAEFDEPFEVWHHRRDRRRR